MLGCRGGALQGKLRVLTDGSLSWEHTQSQVEITKKSPNAWWAESLLFAPLALGGHLG